MNSFITTINVAKLASKTQALISFNDHIGELVADIIVIANRHQFAEEIIQVIDKHLGNGNNFREILSGDS